MAARFPGASLSQLLKARPPVTARPHHHVTMAGLGPTGGPLRVVAVGLPVADEERDEADDDEGKADREADAEGEA